MQSYKEPTHRLKLSLFGDSGVGKTSIVRSLQDRDLEPYETATVGAEFTCQRFELDDPIVMRVETWDTAGQERYRSLASMYYRDVSIFMLCYDCSREMSKASILSYWLPDVLKSNYYDPKRCLIVLMGCKTDIKPSTPLSQDQFQHCEDLVEAVDGRLMHMTCTSTDNAGVRTILETLCRSAFQHNCRMEALHPKPEPVPRASRWSCWGLFKRKSKPKYATSQSSLVDSLL